MQTEPGPLPSQPSAESAVGLAFVAIVLVSLFVAGSLGVVATREAAPAVDPGQEPEATAVAAASTAAVKVRDRIVTRFSELMLLREIALRERDPRLLESVYAPGAAGLARLALRQAPLSRRDRPKPSRAPDPKAVAEVAKTLSSVEDDELRDALARLGAAIKRN